ncbi:hypothetical protein HW555_005068, partial [Spodoptera exigua]
MLCGKHFDNSPFTSSDRKRLNNFAIPTEAQTILAQLRDEQCTSPREAQETKRPKSTVRTQIEAIPSTSQYSMSIEHSNIQHHSHPESPVLAKASTKKSSACYRLLRRSFCLPSVSLLKALLNHIPMVCDRWLPGSCPSRSDVPIASDALTFMAIGLRKNWKQPIAFYFFGDSVTVDRLAVLIKEVLRPCFDTGLEVVGTVCDLDGLAKWSHIEDFLKKINCLQHELPQEAVATSTILSNMDKLFDAVNGDTPDRKRGKEFLTNMTSTSPHIMRARKQSLADEYIAAALEDGADSEDGLDFDDDSLADPDFIPELETYEDDN